MPSANIPIHYGSEQPDFPALLIHCPMSLKPVSERASEWAVKWASNTELTSRFLVVLDHSALPPPRSPLPPCSFLWSFAKWIQAALGPIVIFHQELDIFSSFFFHSFLWLAVLFPVCRFLLWGLFNYYLSVHLSFAWNHLFVCPSVFLANRCFITIRAAIAVGKKT